MAKIQALIGRDHYETRITGGNGALVVADEPIEKGGTNKGMNPAELLGASLASCTCITLRMYADRKEWPMERVGITIDIETDSTSNITNIEMGVLLTGELDDMQRKRLMDIATKCPIHKLLKTPIDITITSL